MLKCVRSGECGRGDIPCRVGPSPGSCIVNRHQYVTAGVGDFGECDFTHTANVSTYLLPPVPPQDYLDTATRLAVTEYMLDVKNQRWDVVKCNLYSAIR